ncbi:flagellar hook protein FlgE [Selenomonas ruminis]|uniref:Flagellar hook protein FlgE n=1 Tax=Selenomonas ruminis TaxID=2593411 RepID=A0A5D6W949_9FIRM|nr:flagellar hook-basal body complex protein [Selenomonas sp. mPRGC5]TYZ23489.1 flagellar hook-basal body complex protein [Selenomonas sp. mPRGC5]
MMRSLFSGVSGLKSHQTRMDTIGNNIANVNTTGFKSSRTTFADTLSQTMTGASSPSGNLGGTNPKQIGLGTGVASIDMIFTDGSVQSTGKNTDLCLSGNGLFVVNSGNQRYYTRDGAFEFDAEGNYVLPGSGLFVQGWMGENGTINTSGAAGNIQIPAGKSMAAAASSIATYANNLNAAALTIKSISGGGSQVTSTKDYDNASQGSVSATQEGPVTLTTADGTNPANLQSGSYIVGGSYKVASYATAADGTATLTTGQTATLTLSDGTTATVSTGSFKVGDNYGTATPPLTISSISVETTISKITKTYVSESEASSGSPVTLTMSDGSKVTETSGKYKVGNSLPVTTTLTAYDTLGNAHSIPVYFTKTKTDSTTGNQWTVSVATDGSGKATIKEDDGTETVITMPDTILQFTTDGKLDSGSSSVDLTLQNGAQASQSITLVMDSLTQYAGNSTINGKANGNAAGTLSSVSVDSSGIITGTYTNGVKQAEAQVAIAQFTNASGLLKTGNSLYQESNNSGTANIKTAADLGVTITPSALEMSNVDIANEFSDMIVTQRGFQSNSKIITVGDEMLETMINMKR